MIVIVNNNQQGWEEEPTFSYIDKGGVLQMVIPNKHGFQYENCLITWMIWGYLSWLRKAPYTFVSNQSNYLSPSHPLGAESHLPSELIP